MKKEMFMKEEGDHRDFQIIRTFKDPIQYKKYKKEDDLDDFIKEDRNMIRNIIYRYPIFCPDDLKIKILYRAI